MSQRVNRLAAVIGRHPEPPPPAGEFDPVTAHTELVAGSTGYFRNAGGNGGSGGNVVYVTSLADSGSGTIRDFITASEPLIILFENGVNGTAVIASDIVPASNKTLWGRHRDGTAADIFMDNTPANENGIWDIENGPVNIIFSNLKMRALGTNDVVNSVINCNQSSALIWVDHVTSTGDFTNGMDGFVDILTTPSPENITVSWCRVEGWANLTLIRNSVTTVTMHNNYFRNCLSRMPKIDGSQGECRAHVYNNWYDGWAHRAVWGTNPAQAVVQGCVFDVGDGSVNIAGLPNNSTDAISVISWDDVGGGTSIPNSFNNGATANSQTTVFTLPYTDTISTVNNAAEQQALRDLLTSGAGWQSSF